MTTDRQRSKCLVCERRRCATLFLLSLKCMLVLVLLTTHSRRYCRHRFNEQPLETRKEKNNNPFFFCESKCGFCTVFRFFFFFSLPFSLCSHNEQADKTGRVSLSFSLSLFNWFRSLLSFSRVLLFSVVACSRLAACFARFVNAVRLECNSSFLLVIFIHGTPSATQPLLFFFF